MHILLLAKNEHPCGFGHCNRKYIHCRSVSFMTVYTGVIQKKEMQRSTSTKRTFIVIDSLSNTFLLFLLVTIRYDHALSVWQIESVGSNIFWTRTRTRLITIFRTQTRSIQIFGPRLAS
jgi:hypothetical protein